MPSDAQRPITFVVPGQALPDGVAGTTLRGGPGEGEGARGLPGRVKQAVRVAALRAEGEPQRLLAVPGEDVVALHIANGPVLLLHPANARDLMLAQGGGAVTRDAESADVSVGAQLRWKGLEQAAGDTVTRGFLGDVVLGAFEILTGFAKDKVADFAASQVVRKVDAQVEAGLYALAPEALPKLKGSGQRVDQIKPATTAQGPLLVLIHGTFVETTSTFGKLWALHPKRVRALFDAYSHREGGRDVHRVYALEHETLGRSPLANALTLVKALPEQATLHLVTHSRGGLVAEVLARLAHQRAVGPADLEAFAAPEYAPQRAELLELAAEFGKRRITVERVVRVACPARGTLLAARRLDAYLSVLKWTIEAAGVPLVPDFVDFLAEVARRRADPAEIPGLAAMIPDTPLVDWLNGAPEPIAGELRVVAGDLEGDSIGSWIKTLLADAYYWTDNDIVVHTRSMYGGAPRAGGASFLLDRGGKTTHFAYFANPRTVAAVVDGVIEPRPPEGFAPIGLLSWKGEDAGGLRGAQRERDPAKPAVFVLPGILGSNLKAGEHRIWLALRLVGGLERLAYKQPQPDDVRPDGAISLVYDQLMEHLEASHEVIEFDFDWRRPIEDEARRLAKAVAGALDARQASGQPVRLLAHSMGGLVARTMQLVASDTWDRLMQHPGARFVMLGTPNGGSYAPMQVLSGDDSFGNVLAAFGSPLRDRKAREIMAAMPGFLQLQAGLLDKDLGLGSEATWRRLADADLRRVQQNNWWHRSAGEAMEAAYEWGVPPQEVLDQAKALREALDAQCRTDLPRFVDKMALVVGHARTTPVGFEEGRDGFVYLDAADGDGRVPLASALLPGVRTWKLDCEHGSLPSAKRAFDAFTELLVDGTTKKLEPLEVLRGEAQAPQVTRSRPSRARKAARPVTTEAAVFSVGEETAEVAAARGGALRITVLNGNLAFVDEPLFIGHYVSSELTGSEYVVNRLIGDKMNQALQIGHYPRALGTQQVFVNTARDPANPWRMARPQAVVVIGLGDEGALRESDLVKAVQQAVLAWSQRLTEDGTAAAATTEIAATLAGSGGIGITPGASARAIARGVRQANQALADVGWPVVTRLTLVEMYLDRATEAWQGLQVLSASSPESFVLAPEIRSGTGPLRRQLEAGYRGAGYDLITAVGNKEGVIEFAFDSKRARTEVREQRTQVALVREMVASGATARSDDRTIGRTLFQLLLPPEIEPFLGGNDRVVLDLDPRTAAIPWELLDAGEAAAGSDRRPWAVRSQLTRRLRLATARTASPTAQRDARAEDHVLLIGEPLVDKDSGYGPLPAAREEALVVQEALTTRGGIDFERVLTLADEPDAMTVIGALFARPWRIVHIAGHGESPAGGGRGVVLSGKYFLTPNEIGNLRTVPELVFVNCCHLAVLRDTELLGPPDHAGFAAGVAAKLIEIGVRCVVACGWAVEDGPAHEFARRFYRELLRGAPFIEAVARAREACWLANPLGKSWAAYQCYGDPNWTFRTGPRDAQTPAATRDEFAAIASPSALALVLDTMVTESRFMGKAAADQQERLRQLEARFADRWGRMGAIAEAFGMAWEAAEQRDDAIRWLEAALKANDASASMKAIETLENLRARRAWDQASKQAAQRGGARRKARGAPAPSAADAELNAALAGLAGHVAQHPTAERWNLLGSAYKRRALIARADGDFEAERAALLQSRDAYFEGAERAAADGVADYFYPALNVMALDLVLQPADAPPPELPTRAAAQASLQAKSTSDPDFWSQVGLVEFELDVALAEGTLARRAAEFERRLADLHLRVDSKGWWGSVANQADLVLGVYAQRGTPEARDAARALWRQVLGYAGKSDDEIDRLTAPPRPAGKSTPDTGTGRP